MALIGANGGLIGTQRSTNSSTAPGLWTPNEQVLLRRASIWPLSGDFFFAYNSLSLHMDGTNGSTTFTDTSSNARTVTPSGNAQISTAQSKFGGASGLFDGSGDYLTSSVTGGLGSGSFTIEFWYYKTADSGFIFNSRTSGTGADGLDIGHNLAVTTSGATMFAGATVSTNQWVHVAIARSGTTLRRFINGTETGSFFTTSSNFSGTDFKIGGSPHGNIGYLTGYMDELRITVGVARYTANFTPPSVPFFDVGTGIDPYFPTTSVLLHMDGTNGSTTFTDNSSNALTVTRSGDAQISTAQSKFGGASCFLDGTGDYLTVTDPDTKLIPALGNFTAECWVYVTTPRIYQSIWRTATGDTFRIFIWDASNVLMMRINTTQYYEGTNNTAIGGTGFSSDAWHHIAVCRVSGVFTLYLNGVSHIVANNQTTYNLASPLNRLGASSTGTELFAGYIDEARFTKDVARYTAAFTPPSGPFPDA